MVADSKLSTLEAFFFLLDLNKGKRVIKLQDISKKQVRKDKRQYPLSSNAIKDIKFTSNAHIS